MVSLISGIVVCIFVFYIVRRSRRRWFKRRKPEAKPEKTVDDSIYQDLDLTKMGTEDNYQSLTGNVARRNKVADDDYESPDDYQDLDVTKMNTEDNYQSLEGDNTTRMDQVADDDYQNINAENQDDYQDLDVTKMSTADNYQSLTGNAGAKINYATDNDEATYTQLSQFRGDENNYQSLT